MEQNVKVREIRKNGDIKDAIDILDSTGMCAAESEIYTLFCGQGTAVFVLSVDGAPVATATATEGNNLPEEHGRQAMTVFSHVAVKPEHQEKGYGSTLLEVIEDYAKDVHESYAISCEVPTSESGKKLIDLYEMSEDAYGFMFTAIEEFSPDEYVLHPDGSVNGEELQYRKEVRRSVREQQKESRI